MTRFGAGSISSDLNPSSCFSHGPTGFDALLRVVLREPAALDDLRSDAALVASELIAVESARTIDRLRLHGSLTTEEAAARVRAVNEWLEAIMMSADESDCHV